MTAKYLEIDSLSAFDAAVAASTRHRPTLTGAVVQSLDLTDRDDVLLTANVRGTVFLGCTLTDEAEEALTDRGALVFPAIPRLPFQPYRGGLYTADELYDSEHYPDALDARVYGWSRSPGSRTVAGSLGAALHDHAVENALTDALAAQAPRNRVGIMGGHAWARGSAEYAEAARLARAIARTGATILTGGGPGAMEAANLGARLAGYPDTALDEALAVLATAPRFADDIDAWISTARTVRENTDAPTMTVGIPTWFYGHEPPNQFATHIAKFFANPLREATLLARCTGGIVYLPGAAGTVQEVFADACENYYAPADAIAPMVMWGSHHWRHTMPAWPLLTTLAAGRDMAEHIHLVDDIDAALAALGRSVPGPTA